MSELDGSVMRCRLSVAVVAGLMPPRSVDRDFVAVLDAVQVLNVDPVRAVCVVSFLSETGAVVAAVPLS